MLGRTWPACASCQRWPSCSPPRLSYWDSKSTQERGHMHASKMALTFVGQKPCRPKGGGGAPFGGMLPWPPLHAILSQMTQPPFPCHVVALYIQERKKDTFPFHMPFPFPRIGYHIRNTVCIYLIIHTRYSTWHITHAWHTRRKAVWNTWPQLTPFPLQEAKGEHAWCRPERKLLFATWKALPLPSWVGLWTARRVNTAEGKVRFVTHAHMGFREIREGRWRERVADARGIRFSAPRLLYALCAMSSCGGVRLVFVYIYGL